MSVGFCFNSLGIYSEVKLILNEERFYVFYLGFLHVVLGFQIVNALLSFLVKVNGLTGVVCL